MLVIYMHTYVHMYVRTYNVHICRYFQISGGLDDFEAALGKNDSEQRIVGSGSCSALIKLLTDNKELYVAHDTWNEYQEMIRIFKYYDLPYSVTSYGSKYIVCSAGVRKNYDKRNLLI